MITLRKVFENHRHASGSEKETPNHFSNCQPQIFIVRLASVSTFFGNMVAANGLFTSPEPWLYSMFEAFFSNNIFKDLQHSSNMDATGSYSEGCELPSPSAVSSVTDAFVSGT